MRQEKASTQYNKAAQSITGKCTQSKTSSNYFRETPKPNGKRRGCEVMQHGSKGPTERMHTCQALLWLQGKVCKAENICLYLDVMPVRNRRQKTGSNNQQRVKRKEKTRIGSRPQRRMFVLSPQIRQSKRDK